ncbi:hypothetical protein FK220_007010 [Flavobacteriaceae bacterium TP-CH-4]|uniref:Uncharacterized protein n=1 Tax=Pelagihabitans pacificus TaxID=2696054 RepID=A0A967AWW7_9FLAO|nr:hypothetical protein [Pelagihabitans pacificus]NHF59082.1 hypothetical protein [Pelagihabitans pacificus]
MRFKFIVLLFIGFALGGCSKDENAVQAEIATLPISNIGLNFAASEGYVANKTPLTETTKKELCWSKSQNPTINDFKQASSNTVFDGIAEYQINMVDLDRSTQYYAPAYAKIGES